RRVPRRAPHPPPRPWHEAPPAAGRGRPRPAGAPPPVGGGGPPPCVQSSSAGPPPHEKHVQQYCCHRKVFCLSCGGTVNLPVETHHLPLRLATGAFILSSGLDKYGADEETAQGLHSTAKGTYPFLDKVAPAKFTQCLSLSEIALGSALILPIVPSRVAGAGLSAFACALLGMYLRAPGMRRPNSLRPAPD